MFASKIKETKLFQEVIESLDKHLKEDPDFVAIVKENFLLTSVEVNPPYTVVFVRVEGIGDGIGVSKKNPKDHNNFNISIKIALYRAILDSRNRFLGKTAARDKALKNLLGETGEEQIN